MKMDTLLLSSLTRWIRETVTLDPGESLDLMDSDVLAKIVTCITEKEGPLLKLTFGESLRLVHEFISSLPDVDTSSLTQTVRSVEESQSVHGLYQIFLGAALLGGRRSQHVAAIMNFRKEQQGCLMHFVQEFMENAEGNNQEKSDADKQSLFDEEEEEDSGTEDAVRHNENEIRAELERLSRENKALHRTLRELECENDALMKREERAKNSHGSLAMAAAAAVAHENANASLTKLRLNLTAKADCEQAKLRAELESVRNEKDTEINRLRNDLRAHADALDIAKEEARKVPKLQLSLQRATKRIASFEVIEKEFEVERQRARKELAEARMAAERIPAMQKRINVSERARETLMAQLALASERVSSANSIQTRHDVNALLQPKHHTKSLSPVNSVAAQVNACKRESLLCERLSLAEAENESLRQRLESVEREEHRVALLKQEHERSRDMDEENTVLSRKLEAREMQIVSLTRDKQKLETFVQTALSTTRERYRKALSSLHEQLVAKEQIISELGKEQKAARKGFDERRIQHQRTERLLTNALYSLGLDIQKKHIA